MFSERTRWDLRPNRLAERLEAKRRAGARVLDLTESNPTRAGIPYPGDVLAPLAGAEARRYEPLPFGLPAAREAVAADFARRGFPVPPDRVVLSASTSEAYAFLFKLLCDPGDDVLVPRPGYPLFEFLATLESVRVRPYPLAHDGEWHVDVAALRSAVGPRTRAIVVVSPNNPTGACLKRDEHDRLEALCAEHSIALVSDEVFADFSFRDDPRRAPSVARDGPALAFALGGLSKSCGLPQLKLAWAAVTGPERLRRDALARLEVVADTYLSVSTPVQVAAPELLARRDELQAPIRARLRANLAALRAAIRPGCPASLLEPEGGWSAVLRVPATRTEEERVTRLLEERDVLVHPGYFFDFSHEAFLVLSLLPPEAVFAEGVARLVADLVL
jgi:aspartate/methionine/tyrosine aminotransferase